MGAVADFVEDVGESVSGVVESVDEVPDRAVGPVAVVLHLHQPHDGRVHDGQRRYDLSALLVKVRRTFSPSACRKRAVEVIEQIERGHSNAAFRGSWSHRARI